MMTEFFIASNSMQLELLGSSFVVLKKYLYLIIIVFFYSLKLWHITFLFYKHFCMTSKKTTTTTTNCDSQDNDTYVLVTHQFT